MAQSFSFPLYIFDTNFGEGNVRARSEFFRPPCKIWENGRRRKSMITSNAFLPIPSMYRNLRDRDRFSRSDPVCVAYMKNRWGAELRFPSKSVLLFKYYLFLCFLRCAYVRTKNSRPQMSEYANVYLCSNFPMFEIGRFFTPCKPPKMRQSEIGRKWKGGKRVAMCHG